MVGKRLADSQLTPEELERQLNEEANQDSADAGPQKASEEVMAGRKIIRVKRFNQEDGSIKTTSGKGTFKLAGSLSSLQSDAPKSTVTQEKEPEKKAASPAKPTLLFKPVSNTTFGQPVEKGAELPKITASATKVFGAASGGAFGGKTLPYVEEPSSKTEAPKSIFGTTPASGSLFAPSKPAESTPATTGSSLFNAKPAEGGNQLFNGGAKPAEGGLFSFGTKPQTGSLFGSTPSGSLFGAPAATGSSTLFGGSTIFPTGGFSAPKKEEEKAGANSEDDLVEAEEEAPMYADEKEVEIKQTFGQKIEKSPFTKIFDKLVNTFKIIAPKEHAKKIPSGVLSLESSDQGGKKQYLVVLRNTTRRALFVGQLDAQRSKHRRVDEKASKHQLKVAAIMTTPDNKKVNAFCTVNFGRHEEMVQFESDFKEAIEDLKSQGEKK